MDTHNTQSLITTNINKGKVKHFQSQEKTIFHYLQNHIATASMVADATGIPQKNITRFKRDLEKRGLLFEVKKTHCKKTGFRAWYLCTNKDLFTSKNSRK